MQHSGIWRAIDLIAERKGLTPSGLARAAGLDPTAFNKSKRLGPDGKPRWPSTESLSRMLAAAGATFEEFAALASGKDAAAGRAIPIVSLAKARAGGLFDAKGFPLAAQETLRFPGLGDEPVYALEIAGESMAPLYREGDVLIVQPGAPIRRGDRVVARTRAGEIMAKILIRRSEEIVELAALNQADPVHTLRSDELDWIARIVWASQ
ncbi:MAG: helix-turn-helix transcriptional regulator [Hyphomonadaceae bacterium]|nr:helix-turn-helix transcriptional regulator [Hyphomonadaceae bacterium]